MVLVSVLCGFLEMEGNLIGLGDRMDQTSHSKGNMHSVELSQPANSLQFTLKTKRAVVKRKITIHLKGLAALMEQCNSKTCINRILAELRCLQQVEELNLQYLSFLPEIEHDKVLEWYNVEFARVNEALNEAMASRGACERRSISIN